MLRFALPAILLLGLVVAPAAAEYPERALTIVVAYPAGGMVDIVARPMADSMKKTFTKGVAVLNRPGGGGSVGMAEVAQAKPDGYTVILAPNSTMVIHPQLNELPYKTPDDYEPILNTITFYTLLTVKADAPWKTMQEFMAAAKANPGKVRVGSPGEGTISHLTLERWQVPGGFKTTHVPFSGWGETSPALLGGHIDAAMAQPGEVKPLVDAKKLRVLAVASPQRHAVLPGRADGQGNGARRRDRDVVRAHGPERDAGARAEGPPRFREGRARRTHVRRAHEVARRRDRLQERRQASPGARA